MISMLLLRSLLLALAVLGCSPSSGPAASDVVAALEDDAGCVAPSSAPLVFEVDGQSNASGRGLVSQLPSSWAPSDPGILVFNNNWELGTATEPIDAPVGTYETTMNDAAAGVGPGLAFARRIRELRPGTLIVLVPCSRGATKIAQHVRPPSLSQPSQFYNICMRKLLHARAITGGRIAGRLWWQGESDAQIEADALGHAAATAGMIEDLRADVGEPTMPFVVIALHSTAPTSGYPFWTTVIDGQWTLDALPDVLVVQARGALNSDGLHVATAGQLETGAAAADAYVLEYMP